MDVFEIITDRMIKQMESGIVPWRKPWFGKSMAVSHATGRPYSLLNQMLLATPGEYITKNAIAKENGRIKKGEKASVIFEQIWKEEKDDDGNIVKRWCTNRYVNVWRMDQVEGIAARYGVQITESAHRQTEADKVVEEYQAREPVKISYNGESAFYRPGTDEIVVPNVDRFTETAEFYSTLFHEMVHSTGHESRLKRLTSGTRFGDEVYSKEELVAEIGSAALVQKTGLETEESFTNSTAYVQGWLKELQNDRHMIIDAAKAAEKAVAFILNNTSVETL